MYKQYIIGCLEGHIEQFKPTTGIEPRRTRHLDVQADIIRSCVVIRLALSAKSSSDFKAQKYLHQTTTK